MKKYKLKKDLPTFKVGDTFWLDVYGNLWSDKHDEKGNYIAVYSKKILKKFPNILTEWFEEIEEAPKTVWELEEGDECFLIVCGPMHCFVNDGVWYHTLESDREIGNVFLTKGEAKKELARRKAKVILERDTKGFKSSKENNYHSYQVYWDEVEGEGSLYADINYGLDGSIPFATYEDAEASIKKHEKEWKIYLGVEE